MSVFRALYDERRYAREQLKDIVHIRVTADAFKGTVTAVPITPERARVLGKLLAVPGDGPLAGTVVPHPGDYERMLEILVHPEDWRDLLVDAEAYTAVDLGEIDRVMGIPVSR